MSRYCTMLVTTHMPLEYRRGKNMIILFIIGLSVFLIPTVIIFLHIRKQLKKPFALFSSAADRKKQADRLYQLRKSTHPEIHFLDPGNGFVKK